MHKHSSRSVRKQSYGASHCNRTVASGEAAAAVAVAAAARAAADGLRWQLHYSSFASDLRRLAALVSSTWDADHGAGHDCKRHAGDARGASGQEHEGRSCPFEACLDDALVEL